MRRLINKLFDLYNVKFPDRMISKDELIPLDYDMKPLDIDINQGSRICSKVSLTNGIYLTQSDIDKFLISAPTGYFFIGFWGHGIDSYAFYYSRVDTWSKVFLRLHTGGVYTDQVLQRQLIANFLPQYIKFEELLYQNVKHLIAVDCMEYGYYKIINKEDNVYELKESLFEPPDFQKKFEGLLVSM